MKKTENSTITREVNLAFARARRAEIAVLRLGRDHNTTNDEYCEAQRDAAEKRAFYNGMDYLASMLGVNVEFDALSESLDHEYWDLFFSRAKNE